MIKFLGIPFHAISLIQKNAVNLGFINYNSTYKRLAAILYNDKYNTYSN